MVSPVAQIVLFFCWSWFWFCFCSLFSFFALGSCPSGSRCWTWFWSLLAGL